MKKVILDSDQYSFDAETKTVTFVKLQTYEHILLITNLTDSKIIYNFGCEGYGGDLSGLNLTLDYDTTLMSDADNLQVIIYTEEAPADTENQRLLELIRKQTEVQDEMLEELKLCSKYLRKIYNPE